MERVICSECQQPMRCWKTGFQVQRAGQIWSGDEFRCMECGVQIVTGFGRTPVAQRGEPDYEAVRAEGVMELRA